MTSRLKRKLGDLGVDTNSHRANESFCLIGTPLPPLEKSKDNGEFVPLWKQDVRDEKGRRRLHGAFTGGFSAGYFNSVGSKEGWTPSEFVSSRADRAKQKTARPEDFMDEEDLQELRDGQDLIDTTEEMDLTGGAQAGQGEEDGSLANILQASMLPAPTDSVGAKILKKMGWRLGQGIGPRVTLRQRRMQDLQARPGQPMSADDSSLPEDDEEASKHTYPPRDTPLLIAERKDNSHGLGYRPGMGLNESLGVKGANGPSGPRLAAGFGLGALNDADEDDLDVYDGGPNQTRNRTAYDIGSEQDDQIIIGGKASKGRPKPEIRSTPAATFYDGTSVLAGFVLSEKPVSEDRWFPMPEIPKGWKPDPNRVWNQGKDKENVREAVSSSEPQSHNKWKTSISADERGTILGETPLPSAPRSVFEYMSKKDRERLQNIASGDNGIKDSPTTPPTAPTPAPPRAPATITIPHTEAHVATAALRGFKPFTAELQKQERYNAYLESQANPNSTALPPKPLPGQKVDEFNKELEDYAKAALIFKPISGAMAGRFTSAAVIDHGPKIHEGLHTPSEAELAQSLADKEKEQEEMITPKAHAAKMGMYGSMTREVKPWQPAKLLCKRFGVKDPNPLPETTSDTAASKQAAEFTEAAPQEAESSAPSFTPGSSAQGSGSGPRDLSNLGLGEDESQGRDVLTYERPSMDVFKAIFASDDEDSDDEAADAKDLGDEAELPAAVNSNALLPTAPQAQSASATAPAVQKPALDAVVDISTFKPTFIPRDNKDKDKGKEKEKKKKKKEKKSILVSFALDEDGGNEPPPSSTKDRPKKKKRKEKEKPREEDEDDAMWVEKPAPDTVKALPLPPPSEPPDVESNVNVPAMGPPKGRKRAIDFM